MLRFATLFMVLSLILPESANAQSTDASEMWRGIIGKRSQKNPAYAYVHNNPKLPNALIYGDSISIGFTPDLREALKGKVNLYRLYRNGGDSSAFITNMERMRNVMRAETTHLRWEFDWDVVQFNVGLHDLKYLNGKKLDIKTGKQVTSPEDYEKNIRDIIAYLKKIAPKAKLIWATTTPIPKGAQGRKPGDATKYNTIVEKVLKDHPEILVNDLHAFTNPHLDKWIIKPGNVHFNTAAKKKQGEETARVILKALEK